MLKFINIPVFIISLAIGLLLVYLFDTEKRVIYVYPKPDNIDTLLYKDATGTCFAPKQKKVSCPKDESELSKIPAQP